MGHPRQDRFLLRWSSLRIQPFAPARALELEQVRRGNVGRYVAPLIP